MLSGVRARSLLSLGNRFNNTKCSKNSAFSFCGKHSRKMGNAIGNAQDIKENGPKIVVVGGVAGGASCVTRCRRLSEKAEIKMIEKGPYVSFANCGLPYYVGDVIHEDSKLVVAQPELFKNSFGINVMTNTEVFEIDRSKKIVKLKDTKTGDQSEENYDYLVLATGSHALRPPIPGLDDFENIFCVRTVPDAVHIRNFIEKNPQVKHAVVCGAGFVGLEVVENLRHLGLEVELIEGADQVLGPLDPEMAQYALSVLENHQVKTHLGQFVSAFEKGEKEKQVVVKTKGGLSIATDLVIMGIGVRPASELAKAAGLDVGERGGIKVNQQMQTSDEWIFAAGDVVETHDVVTNEPIMLPLAGPANRQGRIVADAIFGQGPSRFRGVQGTSVCGMFGMTMAMTGASEKTLKRLGIEHECVYLHPYNHVTYYPDAHQMHVKIMFNPKTGKLLGAQVVGLGESVARRIDVFSMAIQGNMTVFDLEEAELAYSPQYGSAKDAVNFSGMVAANCIRTQSPISHWKETIPLAKEGKIQLLDVRNVEENEVARPEEDVLLIPVDTLRDNLDKLSKDKPIHVFCKTGIRAHNATRILIQNDFHDVKNITGGFDSYPSQLKMNV